MIIIGLTGGIGSGKTTVAKLFSELGIPVYNSDIHAKQLMESSEAIRKEIIGLLGRDAYKKGRLNSSYIADKVFNNKELLQALNHIVHPAVGEHFSTWAQDQSTPYVIQEAAIIFENSSEKRYNKIILVTAPKKIRIARVLKRDGGTKKEIETRIKNQWADSRKRALSDYVIKNIDINSTKARVIQINDHLLKTLGY